MIMVFEKATGGRHQAPEDFSRLMVECNGPLPNTYGSKEMLKAIKVIREPIKL